MKRAAVMAGVFVLLFLAASLATIRLKSRERSISPGAVVPPKFPVVVKSDQGCRIVYFEDLGPLGKETPLLLVPADAREACLHSLLDDARERGQHSARAEFGQIQDDGSQLIQASLAWDDEVVNKGTYRVQSGELRPSSYTSFHGPAVSILSAFVGAFTGLAGLLLVRRLYK